MSFAEYESRHEDIMRKVESSEAQENSRDSIEKQKQELEKELNQYKSSLRLSPIMLMKLLEDQYEPSEFVLSDEEFSTLWEKVQDKLRQGSTVFREYEQRGINLFSENPEQQANLPKLKQVNIFDIYTNPKITELLDALGIHLSPDSGDNRWIEKLKNYLHGRKMTNDIEGHPEKTYELLQNCGIDCKSPKEFSNLYMLLSRPGAGGIYSPEQKTIAIGFRKPNLRESLISFIANGRLHPTIEILDHEIRHHLLDLEDTERKGHSELNEAQAYFQNPLSKAQSNIEMIVATLSAEKGLYQFDKKKAYAAVESVENLYALNFSEPEINALIAKDSWVEEEDNYKLIHEALIKKLNARGLNQEDLKILREIANIKREIEVIKAQKLAQELVIDFVGYDKIDKICEELGSSVLSIMDYSTGKMMPNSIGIIPNNEEFPYSLEHRKCYVLRMDPVTGPKLQIAEIKTNAVAAEQTISDIPEGELEQHLEFVAKIIKTKINDPLFWSSLYHNTELFNHPLIKELTKNDEMLPYTEEVSARIREDEKSGTISVVNIPKIDEKLITITGVDLGKILEVQRFPATEDYTIYRVLIDSGNYHDVRVPPSKNI